MKYEIVTIAHYHGDYNRPGQLCVFEGNHDIPFDIKRIYYVTDVNAGSFRGGHAHKALKQFLFCPFGSVTVTLDDGESKEDIILDHPSKGLVVYPCLWRDILWNIDNSVLCVAASDFYDEKDYIREYNEFLDYIKEGEV